LFDADRGYAPANLLTARMGFLGAGQPAGARANFFREVVERVAAIRGVTHVGLTNALPLATPNWTIRVDLNSGRSRTPGPKPEAVYRIVSEEYFASMGIRLLSGRVFERQDTISSEPVVLVNQSFARQYLAGDPLGVQVRPDLYQYRRDVNAWRIVGVVADVQHASPTDPIQPELYAPIGQMTIFPAQFLTVRTAGDPSALVADLRTIVRSASRNAVLDQVMTMEARVRTSLARPRLYAALVGGFSSFAVLVAAIGLFGGLSYGVTQRRREIGIRTALGATPRNIVSLVVRQGAIMSLAGLAIGLVGATWTGRYLEGFLFGVAPSDPVSFFAVGAVLMLVATVACAIPARRAARIDAIEALRH
jgi:predicted permease